MLRSAHSSRVGRPARADAARRLHSLITFGLVLHLVLFFVTQGVGAFLLMAYTGLGPRSVAAAALAALMIVLFTRTLLSFRADPPESLRRAVVAALTGAALTVALSPVLYAGLRLNGPEILRLGLDFAVWYAAPLILVLLYRLEASKATRTRAR